MDDKRLSEIRARAEAATDGPWDGDGDDCVTAQSPTGIGGSEMELDHYGGHLVCESVVRHNKHFIAHARTDIPDLLAEVERLREVAGLAEGRRECAQANHDQIAQMLDNQNAGLAVMARERDEARAEVERLRSACTGLADAWGEMTPDAEVFTADVGSEYPERDRGLRDALLTCVKAVRP